MLYGAKNGAVKIDGADMHYITYGTGKRVLIILPGLGDGLRMVKGAAVPFAYSYRIFARDYKVYVFSRRDPIQEPCTFDQMAEDIKLAMDKLNIGIADFLGVSMGGMIAQRFAYMYPERLGKLVLAVTAIGCGETLRPALDTWMEMAEQGDYRALMIDTAEMMYTGSYLKLMRIGYPFLSLMKPNSYRRFLTMCRSIIEADKGAPVEQISASTLIIGADQDKVAGVESSYELARRIPDAKMHIFRGYGHGVYDETEDFKKVVADFLKR